MKFVVEALGLKVAGGKELALDLMTRLAKNGTHQFIFIVPDSPVYSPFARSGMRSIACRQRFGLAGRSLLLNRLVRHVCLEERADALLCLGNFAPRVLPCPTVVLLQNAWLVYTDPVAERRRTLRERLVIQYGRRCYRTLPRRAHLVVQTPVMRERLCRRFAIDSRRVAVIPNAIHFSAQADAPPRHKAPADSTGPFTFLCLARYYAHKNLEILLDAMERLPAYARKRARCLLTISSGDHPGAAQLLRQLAARRLANSVINLGPIPKERLAQVYRAADALILPTLLESCSRTYLEAMHFGLPIATSDRDFARHACRDAALYFNPLDPHSVAAAMADLMEAAELRRRLVENGRAILARATGWDELAARFVDALERAARGQWDVSTPVEEREIEALAHAPVS